MPQLALQAKIGGRGRTRTCGRTVMSGRIKDAIADFAAFSLEIDRVRCVLVRSFLVRNWCGGVASWTMHRWQEQTARRIEPMTLHVPTDRIRTSLPVYPLRNLDELLTLKDVDEV